MTAEAPDRSVAVSDDLTVDVDGSFQQTTTSRNRVSFSLPGLFSGCRAQEQKQQQQRGRLVE